MKSRFFSNPLFQIHTAVFLWGFTAIFGKLISIDALGLVFLRMLFAAGFYLLLKKSYTGLAKIKTQHLLWLFTIGFLICIHWFCFYQSIKECNSSSITLVCLGTGPMFTVWIEYILRIKKRLSFENLLISALAIIGLFLIANDNFSLNNYSFENYQWAIIYAVLAAFFAATFTIMNSRISNSIQPEAISFVEMLSGAICIGLFLFLFQDFEFLFSISQIDLFYLLVLSLVCTNIPFLLSIYSLKKLSAFVVTLSVNLEPIYGLILAAIIFNEHEGFGLSFYLGTILILISVFLPLMIGQWKNRKA